MKRALVALLCFSPLAIRANDGPVFEEAASKSGLKFVHQNGMDGNFYVPEEMGAGVALFDMDNDGDLDVYLVQGGPFQAKNSQQDALFRNDLREGLLQFSNVTAKASLPRGDYGMGVATGDIDGDGKVDLFIANFGQNRLLRNLGDGRFKDVTTAAGITGERWSVSASFADMDRDGDLDLYVANYVLFNDDLHQRCITPSGRRDYCGPNTFPDAADRFYRNRGDGTFEDVTKAVGLDALRGSGLGVISGDFDGNGWLDWYVANDADPNFLLLNQGNGTFREDGLLAGNALNGYGNPEAGMGVDAGDVDGDGDADLIVTHLTGESHTLYINQGDGFFEDKTAVWGLQTTTLNATGFGGGFIDVDNDGWLDLLVVNGTVMAVEALLQKGDSYPLKQADQLFLNQGGQRFVVKKNEPALAGLTVSRGAAFGDIDNDGDVDVVVNDNQGPTRLLLNRIGARNRWLRVTLKTSQGTFPIGAKVTLARVNAAGKALSPLIRWPRTDGSYASANDPRVVFGLDQQHKPVSLTVTWPDGNVEAWPVNAYNTDIVLQRGKGSKP